MKMVCAILVLVVAMLLTMPACCVARKLPPPKMDMPKQSFILKTFDKRDIWVKCPEAIVHSKDIKENLK